VRDFKRSEADSRMWADYVWWTPFKKTHRTSDVDEVPEPRSAAGTQLWYATGPPSTVSLSHHELQTHLLLKPDLITSNLSH